MELITQIQQGDFSGVDVFIEQILVSNYDQALQHIQALYQQLNINSPSSDEQKLIALLKGLWNFCSASQLIEQEAKFQEGQELMEKAYTTFSQLQLHDLQKLAQGLYYYYAAIADIRMNDLNAGLKKLEQTKAHFKEIDKYSQHYRLQVDILESESYFLNGIQHITQLNYTQGQIAIEQAAQSVKKIAKTYYQSGDETYHWYIGLNFVYLAFSAIFLQHAQLDAYSFDYFEYHENEASSHAQKAIEHISLLTQTNEVQRQSLDITKGIHLLTQATWQVGLNMHHLLNKQQKDITFDIKGLKILSKNAANFFVQVGEQAISMVRLCQQIDNRIINIQRFIQHHNLTPTSQLLSSNLLKEKVQQYLQKGQIKQAIDYLVLNCREYDTFNDVLLLKTRYIRLQKDGIRETVSNQDLIIAKNRLTKDLMTLLDLL